MGPEAETSPGQARSILWRPLAAVGLAKSGNISWASQEHSPSRNRQRLRYVVADQRSKNDRESRWLVQRIVRLFARQPGSPAPPKSRWLVQRMVRFSVCDSEPADEAGNENFSWASQEHYCGTLADAGLAKSGSFSWASQEHSQGTKRKREGWLASRRRCLLPLSDPRSKRPGVANG
jgi:hypothetical protein